MNLSRVTEALETTSDLDPAVEAVDSAAQAALPAGPVRDALHGSWLGHRLHPLLVTLPIGLNIGVTVLDLVGDEDDRDAAALLQGVAVAVALPTALAGLADWAGITEKGPKRVGLVHGLAAVDSTVLYGASLVARLTDHPRAAAVLTLLGDAAVGAAGYLGGHLAYVNGVGVKAAGVGGTDAERVATEQD